MFIKTLFRVTVASSNETYTTALFTQRLFNWILLMTKILNAVIGAPGSGKSQKLIEQIPTITTNTMVIYAVPTNDLADEIAERIKVQTNTEPCVINGKRLKNTNVTRALNTHLAKTNYSIIITTHEAVRRSDPKLYAHKVLIIDELPSTLSTVAAMIDDVEYSRIQQYTELCEPTGKLKIKNKHRTIIQDQVTKYDTNQQTTNLNRSSTLSKFEYQVFRALLDNQLVVVTGKNKNRTIVIANENKLYEHFNSAKEVYIIAANIIGGEFEVMAKLNGFSLITSQFSPKRFAYSNNINIFVMAHETWTKSKSLDDMNGNRNEIHLGLPRHQQIDEVLHNALTHISSRTTDKPLVFANKWAKLEAHDHRIKLCNLDMRGINRLSDHTNAILLFSGQPGPRDKTALQAIADTYGVNQSGLTDAWIMTKKLETSLQAITRTAIREHDNKRETNFYVQDYEVAKYLKQTYMPNAVIDFSLALYFPKREDKRRIDKPLEDAAYSAFIDGISTKIKPSQIIKNMKALGIPQATAYRLRNQFLERCNSTNPNYQPNSSLSHP